MFVCIFYASKWWYELVVHLCIFQGIEGYLNWRGLDLSDLRFLSAIMRFEDIEVIWVKMDHIWCCWVQLCTFEGVKVIESKRNQFEVGDCIYTHLRVLSLYGLTETWVELIEFKLNIFEGHSSLLRVHSQTWFERVTCECNGRAKVSAQNWGLYVNYT